MSHSLYPGDAELMEQTDGRVPSLEPRIPPALSEPSTRRVEGSPALYPISVLMTSSFSSVISSIA